MKLQNYDNINLYRAISDLKLGLSVIITDNENIIEFFAGENFNFSNNNFTNITISNRRAEYLFNRNEAVTIDISFHKDKANIANKIIYLFDKNLDLPAKPATKLEQLAIKLIKLANLLPCAVQIFPSNKSNNAIKLNYRDVDNYILKDNLKIKEICQTSLKLKHALNSKIIVFKDCMNNEYYAIQIGNYADNPVVRIHSSCYTGDLLSSLSCDCGDQLTAAIKYMNKEPGLIIYLMQEGRSIGLINKLRAYNLQEKGFDTVEANRILGFEDDERDFTAAVKILKILGINKIDLLSNNPRKIKIFTESDIEVNKVLPLKIKAHKHNEIYLKTKANKLGHILEP